MNIKLNPKMAERLEYAAQRLQATPEHLIEAFLNDHMVGQGEYIHGCIIASEIINVIDDPEEKFKAEIETMVRAIDVYQAMDSAEQDTVEDRADAHGLSIHNYLSRLAQA